MILHIFWAQINSFWDNLSGQKSPPNEAQNISYPKSESPSPKLYIIMSLQGIFINNICDLSVLFSLLIFLSLHSVQLGPWLTWSKYQLKQFEESGILGLFCETTTTKFNWKFTSFLLQLFVSPRHPIPCDPSPVTYWYHADMYRIIL